MASLEELVAQQRAHTEALRTGGRTPRQVSSASGGGLARFFVPAAGALAGSFLGGPAGLVAGGAAGAGLLNLLGNKREEEETLFDAVKRDALFSLLGLGAGKVIAPVAGAAAKKLAPLVGKGASTLAKTTGKSGGGTLGRIGEETGENVFRPTVIPGTFAERDIKHLKSIARLVIGSKGGPRAQSRQFSKAGSAIDDFVKGQVKQENRTLTGTVLKQFIKQNKDRLGSSIGPEDAAYIKVFNKLSKDLLKSKDLKDVYGFKGKLAVGKIYDKFDKGIGLTGRDEAVLSLHKAAGDIIEKEGSPLIRTLNQIQNSLNPLAAGAQKEAGRTAAFPLIGAAGSGIKGGIKAGQDKLSRGSIGLGEGGQTALAGAVPPIGGAIGAGLGTQGGGQQPQQPLDQNAIGQQPQPQQQLVPETDANGTQVLKDPATGQVITADGQWMWDQQSNDWLPAQQGTGGLGDAGGDPTQMLAAQALQLAAEGDLKGSDQAIQLANLFRGLTKDANQAKKQEQSDIFIGKALDNIDNVMEIKDLGYGPIAGKAGQASIGLFGGSGSSKKVVELNQRYQLIKLNILRAYQGARISDADFQLANLYTPSISDTDQTARTKLEVLRAILSGRKENPLPAGEEPSTNTSTDFSNQSLGF